MSNNVQPIRSKADLCRDFLKGILGKALDEIGNWTPGPMDITERLIQGAAENFGPHMFRKIDSIEDEDVVNICKQLSDVIMDNLVILEQINNE